MLRTTLFARFVTATLLTTACTTDEHVGVEDFDTEVAGKGDGWAFPAEQVLVETSQPDHVMQDSTYVYYVLFTKQDEVANPQTRSLIRVRRSDGKREKIATLVGFIDHAVLAGNTIYFTDRDSLFEVSKTGGQPQPLASVPGATALAADDRAVYFSVGVAENEQYFHRISKLAAGSTTPVELARATHVTSLAVDDTHVYWLDETQPNPAIGCGAFAGLAKKVSKNGGLAVTLQTGINCPMSLAVDTTSVYYSHWGAFDTSDFPLVKLSKLGGLPLPIGHMGGMQIVLSPSHVYWISPEGDLMRRGKTFGVPFAIASDVDHAIQGADARGAYFWREELTEAARTYSLHRIGQ